MQLNRFLSFADYVKTVKPIPAVKLGTHFYITAVAVHKGRVCCSAVVMDAKGKISQRIGPYPESAFQYAGTASAPETDRLIKALAKE